MKLLEAICAARRELIILEAAGFVHSQQCKLILDQHDQDIVQIICWEFDKQLELGWL